MKGQISMTNNKISLFRFMTAGLLTFVLLMVLQAIRFAPPAPFVHALSPFSIPWFLGGNLLMYFPYCCPKSWLLSHRCFLLLCSIAWPLLDGFLVLNTMAAYNGVSWFVWVMELIALGSLVITSLLGIIASLRCDKIKERETAFLFSLIIGIFAIWEYYKFSNFGYSSFFFAAVMVTKLLNPQNTSEVK